MLSKCIKMPKYSFKRNLFFAIWGGPWLILAYPPHLTCITSAAPQHCVGRTMHNVGHTAHFVGRAPRIVSAIQSVTRNIQSTSSSKFFYVFWHFLVWKNKFFLNWSKLPKGRNQKKNRKIWGFYPKRREGVTSETQFLHTFNLGYFSEEGGGQNLNSQICMPILLTKFHS